MNIHPETFINIYRDLISEGIFVSPRGLLVLELENYNYELPPYVRFCNFVDRKLNINYIKEEFKWYLKGERFDQSITRHAKMWIDLVNADGSINSNYGQYIFGKDNQFERVVNVLKEDKDSRRGTIAILNKEHLLSNTADVPCTMGINFRIREDKLNMTVRMRSQDAIYGMGNDAPAFSFIHEMMYNALLEYHPTLKYGMYYHSADSFHVYERHFKMLEKLSGRTIDDVSDVGISPYEEVNCPAISGPEEVKSLLKIANKEEGEDNEKFLFSRWLYSI